MRDIRQDLCFASTACDKVYEGTGNMSSAHHNPKDDIKSPIQTRRYRRPQNRRNEKETNKINLQENKVDKKNNDLKTNNCSSESKSKDKRILSESQEEIRQMIWNVTHFGSPNSNTCNIAVSKEEESNHDSLNTSDRNIPDSTLIDSLDNTSECGLQSDNHSTFQSKLCGGYQLKHHKGRYNQRFKKHVCDQLKDDIASIRRATKQHCELIMNAKKELKQSMKLIRHEYKMVKNMFCVK